ncbi:MAG: hypothetical protein K2K47_00165, partial [Duncaniella sp.]|nr:hypothetical protein [Duncaniella sp.]
MKKYVRITAGRGPVECARAVTLVARELLKAVPELTLSDSEPHNSEAGCYMSLTFSTDRELPPAVIEEWQGTILWRSPVNPYRPAHRRSTW